MNAFLTFATVWGIAAAQVGDAGGPPRAEATFRIDENSPRGTFVGSIPHDGGPAQFELIDCPPALSPDRSPATHAPADDAFAVDTTTGQIVVESPTALDFEQRPEFTLTVRVTSSPPEDDPLLKSFNERLGGDEFGDISREMVVERSVRVVLLDVNEAPGMTEQSFVIGDATVAESTVGTVAASDPDAGDRLSFALVEGNDSGAFRIDAHSGVLRFDRERLARLEGSAAILRVQVTDRGGLSSTAPLRITLPPRPAPPLVATTNDGPVEAPRPSVVQVLATRATQVTRPTTDATSGTGIPAPAGSGPQSARRAWWLFWSSRNGVSPVVVALLGLLGVGAHVLRTRTLRRKLDALLHELHTRQPERVVASAPLSEAGPEPEDESQLAEACAQLAEDRAQLADEQRQLAFEREDLAARREELAAAEALLHEQRAELEEERRRLQAEWARHAQHPPAHQPPYADGHDDLYAVDEDGRRPESPGGGSAGGSTWVDSSETADGDDPELAALRANLAGMFGRTEQEPTTPDGGAGDEVTRGRQAPPSDARLDPLAPMTEVSAGSRDSLYRRRPSAAPAGGSEHSGAGEGDDPIGSYMDALLKRLRQNGQGATANSAAPAALSNTSSAAPASRTGPDAGIAPAPEPVTATRQAAAPPTRVEAPLPRSNPAPRPKPDRAAVRDTVDSLREVANLSARSAVATYVRRTRSRRGILVGLTYVALLGLATALLAGCFGRPVANVSLRWLVLGAAAVVTVYYFWSVCLANRRRLSRELHVVPRAPRGEQSDHIDSASQPPDRRGRETQRTPSPSPRSSRPGLAAPAGRENTPPQSDHDETCVTPAARG